MTITKVTCELLHVELGVCPVKPAWVKKCPYEDFCKVKRKFRKYDKVPNFYIECDVLDCSNNISNHCDTKHSINDKAICQTYLLNREWFLSTLKSKVNEGLDDVNKTE